MGGIKIFILLIFTIPPFLSFRDDDELYDEMKENFQLALASYCHSDEIMDWSCYWCKNITKKYSNVVISGETPLSNFFYTAIQDNKTLVIVFRGSLNIKRGIPALINYIMDFDFILTHLDEAEKDVKVHLGFKKCYDDVKDQAIGYLESSIEKFNVENILIIGYSLGSPIATLVGQSLNKFGNEKIKKFLEEDKVRIMNFGCPRFGNKEFFDYFEKQINMKNVVRVVNQRDPITAIPPKLFNYHHLAYEYFFENNMTSFVKCDGSGEDPNCGDKYFHDKHSNHEIYLGLNAAVWC